METTETYYCFVDSITNSDIGIHQDETFTDEYTLLRGSEPTYEMSSYEDAIRVLYNPSKPYSCSVSSPMHKLNPDEIRIVKRTIVTKVTEEESFHGLSVAKELNRKIINWKYGKGGTYEDSKHLAKRLRENQGKVREDELEEYRDFCKDYVD